LLVAFVFVRKVARNAATNEKSTME